ncbi:hypothetical protein AT15_09505 [Kosmotoga arenicorallina S304]|uniref:Uncharacterized protein n=1 Tax=Kosmotoga arenicorallina S304 TaxID=1453497 RepID=A0A176K1Z1_9BACT|nr:hypothetical protein [Kosmotoga arenicorallina]OAA30909.1 hypothetical protein AT15_09505 [Kosmotoga arenicorallina S304]
MKAHHVAESTILELLKGTGFDCPICSALSLSTRSWIESTLSNLMHNFEPRGKLLKGGLCKRHRRLLFELASSEFNIGALPLSLLLDEMLPLQLKALEKRKVIYGDSCYLCKFEGEASQRYIDTFGNLFNLQRWKKLYEDSERIICADHSAKMLSHMKSKNREWFISVQKRKFSELHTLLKRYIKKHDHKSKEPFGIERNSWKLLLKLIGETKT